MNTILRFISGTIFFLCLHLPVNALDVAQNKISPFLDGRNSFSIPVETIDKAPMLTWLPTRCCFKPFGRLMMPIGEVFSDTLIIGAKLSFLFIDRKENSSENVYNTASLAFFNPILNEQKISSGKTELTIIHGVDLNPSGQFGPMTGFDLNLIELSIVSSEKITSSKSGKEYTAESNLMTIAELRSKFPTYDIDAHFYGANDSSAVIVSTAIVPSAEFPVPDASNLISSKECATLDPQTANLRINHLSFPPYTGMDNNSTLWVDMCLVGNCKSAPFFGVSNFGVNVK